MSINASETQGTFPTLTTSRLSLRELLPGDAPSLFSVHGDAEGMRWFGTDPMTDSGEAEKLIQVFADWRRGGSGVRWAVERVSDGLLLGTCGSSVGIGFGEAASLAMSWQRLRVAMDT